MNEKLLRFLVNVFYFYVCLNPFYRDLCLLYIGGSIGINWDM